MKRFVKRGRTKLPLGRGVSTAGGNVDTAFKVALHDVFQCGHAPFGQYAQASSTSNTAVASSAPEKVFVATGSTSHRAQYARAARPPLQGHRHRQSVGAFGFRNQPILFAGLSGIEIKRESDLLDNEPCFGI